MTRVLCLVLVAMMAVAVFAGCNKQPKDTTPTDVSTVTETTPEAVPEPIIVGPEDDDPYTISQDADGKDVNNATRHRPILIYAPQIYNTGYFRFAIKEVKTN